MKKRSVSSRHIFGALLGGILGILGFGYFNQFAMPFGCFLGVIIGFAYEKIWQSIPKSLYWLISIMHLFKIKRKNRSIIEKKESMRNWAHIAYFALNLLLSASIGILIYHKVIEYHIAVASLAVTLAILLSFGMFCVIMINSITYMVEKKDVPLNRKVLPRVLKLRMAIEKIIKGHFRFFIEKLISLLYYELSLLLSFFIFICNAIASLLMLVIVAIPILTIIGPIKGLYKISIKGGYWPCFSVTLITTATIAFFFQPSFKNPQALWLIALLSGLTSAIITESLRRLLANFFLANKSVEKIATKTFGKYFSPIIKKLESTYYFVTKKINQIFVPVLTEQ